MNVRVGLFRKLSAENWCFWTVVLEKTLESPLDYKEIKPVHPKRNQSWKFVGKTDAEAETLILWPPDMKNRLVRKDLDAGKDWRQEKGITEDEMVGWDYQLKERDFVQTPGDGEGQGNLACCSPSGLKESDTTEPLNNKKNMLFRTETVENHSLFSDLGKFQGVTLCSKNIRFAECVLLKAGRQLPASQ